jgi:hypothetical protein
MPSGRVEERHRHVALVASSPAEVHEFDRVESEGDPRETAGFSLLRLSVPARLLMVAVAAALLWGAVFWALA